MFVLSIYIHDDMYYHYIISLKIKYEDMKQSTNKSEFDNEILLKVTNQTDPSIQDWDIDSGTYLCIVFGLIIHYFPNVTVNANSTVVV